MNLLTTIEVFFLFGAILLTVNNLGQWICQNDTPGWNYIIQAGCITGFIVMRWYL